MASITVTPEPPKPAGRLALNNGVLSRSPAAAASRDDGTASSSDSLKSALARSITGTLAFYL